VSLWLLVHKKRRNHRWPLKGIPAEVTPGRRG
jgi:hypothetical protein